MKDLHVEYTEEYLQEMDDNCAKAAEQYQGYVHQLKLYESLSKDFLASLKMEIRKEEFPTEKVSDAELETRARADKRWKDFRAEQFKQLVDAGKKQILYENSMRRVQVAISGLALRREQYKRHGV